MLSAGSVFLDVLPNMAKFGPALKAQTALANSSLAAVAGPVGLIGVALAGIGTVSIKAAIDFESSFAGVRKTVDATEAQFAKLEQGVRDMAKEMPASTSEITAVAEAAGQLGIKTPAILEFSRTMIDLGNMTNLAADEAANALARIANITQMPQQQFDNLGATIVDLGNNLAATESELTEMALRIAGAGSQIGLSEAQILAFGGALSSVGINAEAGGSAISRTFIDMDEAVSEAGPTLETFAKVAGLTSAEFQKMWGEDAAGATTMFVEGLGDIEKSGGDVFGTLRDLEITEIRQRDALLRLAGAGNLLNRSLEIGDKAWKDNNALQNEAQKRYDTTAAKLSVLWNKFKDLGLELGQQLLPLFNKVLDWLLVSLPAGIEWGKRFIKIFEKAWFHLQDAIGNVIEFLLKGWRLFLEVFFTIAGKILDAAALAFGWIPGIGDRVKKFQAQFKDMSSGVLGELDRQIERFEGWSAASRKNIDEVRREWDVFARAVNKGVSPQALQVDFDPGTGDGPGFASFGAGAGFPISMAQQAMAAVPGFQTITSGYRPFDTGSFHSIPPPWNAVDIGGTNLEAIFNYLAASVGATAREIIGGHTIIQHGRASYYAPSDHPFVGDNAHVHLADEGGTFVNRGSGIGLVGLGPRMSEQVTFHGAQKIGGRGGTNYYLTIHADSTTDGRRLARVIRGELEAHDRFKEGRGRMDRA